MLRETAKRLVLQAPVRRTGRIVSVNSNGTYDLDVLGTRFSGVGSLLGADYRVGQEVAVSVVGGRLVLEE